MANIPVLFNKQKKSAAFQGDHYPLLPFYIYISAYKQAQNEKH